MKEQFGFTKVYKTLVDWEWYTDVNTCKLFLHCLLKANYSSKKWRGIKIHRGQFITSLEKLAVETGLSLSKIRTAIAKLSSTGDLIIESNNQFTKITVTSEYYDSNGAKGVVKEVNDKQNSIPVLKLMTNEQQSKNNQLATTKNKIEAL